jgi:hypothetical protein
MKRRRENIRVTRYPNFSFLFHPSIGLAAAVTYKESVTQRMSNLVFISHLQGLQN